MPTTVNATVAATKHFRVKQNQTFNPVIVFTDAASGDPIDFTGATARMSIRKLNGDCVPCQLSEATNRIFAQEMEPTVTGADNNVLEFNEVIRLDKGTYKYDLLIIAADGNQTYYLEGQFIVERSYTQPNAD